MSEPTKTIFQRISSVMLSVEALAKDRKNIQQNYSFRGIDDVYNDIHPLFSQNGIFSTSKILSERSEERQSKNGGLLIYRILHIEYTFYGPDGDSVTTEVIGEGMDSGDKASNKAMAVAHKYAIMQMLSIPTEDPKDPENDSPTPLPKHAETPQKTIQAPQQAKPQAAPEVPTNTVASSWPGLSVADLKTMCENPTSGISFEGMREWIKNTFAPAPGTKMQDVLREHATEIKEHYGSLELPF